MILAMPRAHRCKLVYELMRDVGPAQHGQGPGLISTLQEVLQQRLIVLRIGKEHL